MKNIFTVFADRVRPKKQDRRDYSVTSEQNYFSSQSKIFEQQQEIERLNNFIADEEGEYTLVNDRRKYTLDDNQGRFERKKHRNLTDIALDNFRSAGLEVDHTSGNNQDGDIEYRKTPTSKARLGIAFDSMQSRKK